MKALGIYRFGWESDDEWERRKERQKFVLERVFGEKVVNVMDRGYMVVFEYEEGVRDDGKNEN